MRLPGLSRRPQPSASPPPLPARDPLAAVPLVAPGVQAKADASGLVQVRLELPARSRLEQFLGRTLGFRRPAYLNLDQLGSAYWRLVDGQRDLRAIAARLTREHQVPADRAREAVAFFTRDLMLRHVICLRIAPPSATTPGPA